MTPVHPSPDGAQHAALPLPSSWLQRWAHLIRPGGTVLDVACGSGRHVRYLAAQGFRVTGVDRDGAALLPLHRHAEIIQADLEAGAWPLGDRQFDAVVVTNYLWRPLWPRLLASLAPGGVLVYETFATGQQTIGRPSREAFLLQRRELLNLSASLHTVAFEDGFLSSPDRFVQRLTAVREASTDAENPMRYPLAT